MSRDVAVFDFDGTLCHGDSLLPFLAFAAGRGRLVRALARRGPRIALALAGIGTREVAKWQLLSDVLGGMPLEEVEDAGKRFAGALSQRLRPDVLARFEWHRSAGHRTVLLSASPSAYLDPLGEQLGYDAVLCTRLEAVDGRLTGRGDGRNCRGPEKVARLTAWLGDDDHGAVWAYGDSAGDKELLAYATFPHRVTRRPVSRVPAGVDSRAGEAS